MTIEEAIKILAHRGEHFYPITGKIESVNISKRTCNVSPTNGDSTLIDVRLQAIQAGNTGILFIPKKDSNVIVGFLSKNEAFIILYQDIEKVMIDIGNTVVEINDTNIIINNGNLGGLVKITQLIDKLNKIETDINTLKSVFSAWTPVANDGGAALKTAVSSWTQQQLSITQQNELENTKIKHG